MFLKSLILKGFKTFADKEEFDFDLNGGITAVVGPNGCGKSNVVDSFRFALGESNFRDLRVHSIPEVIFAGTEARKPLSLAEVALIFDNSDKTLPIDYSEVSVKRRVFRDGESEFLINNQSCRLKDIRDMFLDSGLSIESISIMSQGNVDSVLSSKPEERRSIFEEVAGINKYKFRKIEAERKLILSEQNLLRISDLKIEIGEQLLALEAQATSAREYKDIQEKLKDLELSTFKKQLKALLMKKESVLAELVNIKRSAQEREEKIRSLQNEKIQKMHLAREIEGKISGVLSEIEKVKDNIEDEKGGLVLERERLLFEEKNKIRDSKEEVRFLAFEIKKLLNNKNSLDGKRRELEEKSREISIKNLDEFKSFKDVINLTVKLSQILKDMVVCYYGKSWEALKDDPSYGKFSRLIEEEIKRIGEETETGLKEIEFKGRHLEELNRTISEQERVLLEHVKQTEEFIRTPSSKNIENLMLEKGGKLNYLEDLRKQKEKLSNELETLERSSVSFTGEAGNTSDLLRHEVNFAKIEGEISQIESLIREEYGMSQDALLQYPKESENVNKSKKEIADLRARQRALEPVNLLAIDEYEKCKERHLFIESQHQDVVMARENLKTLINELDLKAREDFIKTMEALAKNFSLVFSELFEGGEAQIMMEKGKDALEAGIEISVRPNKRKWLNLSLLSGGERALTAIALLFAILKTSPSPICILDEVDAALDDANIGRFAQYLRKFSESSQIIVITHNKRTMAVADIIYGVTMEEPGISRVVSMKLEKAV